MAQYESPGDLRDHLQMKMAEATGTNDMAEAERRMEVLHEWRFEDKDWYRS